MNHFDVLASCARKMLHPATPSEKAKPILDELHEYLVSKKPHILPKSPLGQAVSYTLNRWPRFLVYLNDGRLENNNNRLERAIKPFVIGRKGWLFADSVAGANAARFNTGLVTIQQDARTGSNLNVLSRPLIDGYYAFIFFNYFA